MARSVELTRKDSPAGDLEDVRLLDSYEDEEAELSKVEQGMSRIQVRITGMTCAACSNAVETALISLNGVVSASVALLQNKADVVFHPSVVNVCY
ncbi:hypothetical protein DCAR_0205629 [Daucus carota subsp. sativus]|uniref:Uncharacterized protein n=1 Tax=Daucus carota subsp. sativus TaxID=79200 RepID=A0A175YBP9_DAUCS|nr:hypothetical protein DCAR_0205629 [Daucus carota subsp. sativus]